jgi:2,3-dihydro-2,3-dihydroxybenzoate dehydrogenase
VTLQPRFQGKTALVTGAASGIGRGIARALAAEGAYVVATDVDNARLAESSNDLAGDRGMLHPLDVGDPNAVDELVAMIEKRRSIDLLANVAGVLQVSAAHEIDVASWEKTFRVNAAGVFHVSRAVARHMMKRRSGAIVTVSSNAARVPRVGMAAYAASKAAASMFTRCLGLELAPLGIRCNVVSPGSTDTPMQQTMARAGSSLDSAIKGDLQRYRLGIPLGRIAQVSDVASSVLFLLSDDSRHIALQELVIDGGATLGG